MATAFKEPPVPLAERQASLIARLKAGTADQQEELLDEAWELLANCRPDFRNFALAAGNAGRFGRLLDARGFVDAALMLVPRGQYPEISFELNICTLFPPRDIFQTTDYGRGTGATVALAIAAAALQAWGLQ